MFQNHIDPSESELNKARIDQNAILPKVDSPTTFLLELEAEAVHWSKCVPVTSV